MSGMRKRASQKRRMMMYWMHFVMQSIRIWLNQKLKSNVNHYLVCRKEQNGRNISL